MPKSRAPLVFSLALLWIGATGTVRASAASWEGPASVGVELKDRAGAAVPGAVVRLRLESGTGSVAATGGPPSARTDSAGTAAFGGLAEGEWFVEISHPDFMSFTAYVMLRAGKAPKTGFTAQVTTASSSATMRVAFVKPRTVPPRAAVVVVEREQAPSPTSPLPSPANALPAPAAAPLAPAPSPPPAATAPTAPPAVVAPAPPAPATAAHQYAAPAPTPVPASTPTPPPAVASPPPPAVAAPVVAPPELAAPAVAPPAVAPPAIAPPAVAAPAVAPPAAAAPAVAVPAIASPTPAAPPPQNSAAPPPSPPVPPSIPPPLLRSADRGNCPECRPGESALSIESVAAIAGPDCELALASERAATTALAPSQTAGLGIATRGGPADRSCQLLSILLPPSLRYLGYRYEAEDRRQAGGCAVDADCTVGEARFRGHPALERRRDGTLVTAAFENRSIELPRTARLTVYFRAQGSPLP